MDMSRRVPERGHVPEWPSRPDYGQQRQSGNGQRANGHGPQGHRPTDYQGGRPQGNMRRYEDQQWSDDQRRQVPGPGPGDPALPDRPKRDVPKRRKHFRRTRRFFRSLTGRIISAIIGVFLLIVAISAGQAAFKNNGQGVAANVAEWARDHGLGPIVTFGEWVSYNPPKTGGKPTINYAVPSGEAVTPVKPAKGKTGFVPDIPATLKPLAAGGALPGEG